MNRMMLLAALLAATTATAQQQPPVYDFSANIEARLRADANRNQQAAWEYSRIGDYRGALRAWDAPNNSQNPGIMPAADSTAFAAYRPQPAVAYVLARARQERIIIVNEAHHNSRHRAFTASLLPGLKAQGYRYLALEGLSETDTLLARRGYPVLSSGYYASEPGFGNMLRTAAGLGFKLVGYDYGFGREGDWPARQRAREQAQARNIQRILQADPQAKIIVHCGFSHITEKTDPEDGSRWMASYLRELTGIDPFTLDQTKLSEAAKPAATNRYYRPQPVRESAVLLNAQKQPFKAADAQYMSVDANVYHPPTTYVQGRPNWLFVSGRQPVAVAKRIQVPYPCLVLAYVAGEPLDKAIPVDVVELPTAATAPALVLAKGRYTIVVRSQSGKIQQFELSR